MTGTSMKGEVARPVEVQRLVVLGDIQERAGSDTRRLAPGHVVQLAQSLEALGVLEPLVVDRNNLLLAGGHRLAALRLLALPKAERETWLIDRAGDFKGRNANQNRKTLEGLPPPENLKINLNEVPVRVIDIDSRKDVAAAFAIETAENTQRREYTREEILSIYQRLLDAGYVDQAGGGPQGKNAKPTVAAITGKSVRYIRKVINTPEVLKNKKRYVTRAVVRQEVERLQKNVEMTISRGETLLERGMAGDKLRNLMEMLKTGELQEALEAAHDELSDKTQGGDAKPGGLDALLEKQVITFLKRSSGGQTKAQLLEGLDLPDQWWSALKTVLDGSEKVKKTGLGRALRYGLVE